LAWFEQHAFNEGPYGEAEVLATAKALSISVLDETKILQSRAGKVRLLRRDELSAEWNPSSEHRLTVWAVTQHLIFSLDKNGETAAATLASKVGGMAETARDLAYRLYVLSERKGWAEEAWVLQQLGYLLASYRTEVVCTKLRFHLDQSMAITNHERVGKALEQLNTGLRPFVERELKATYKERWAETARPSFPNWQQTGKDAAQLNWDTQALLGVMWDLWNDCFRKILGPSDRSLVSELRDVRNKWAHQKAFSTDDAYRAIDTISRLLTAVAAPEVEQVDQMKAETLRVKFDEQVRSQKRKGIEHRRGGKARCWPSSVA